MTVFGFILLLGYLSIAGYWLQQRYNYNNRKLSRALLSYNEKLQASEEARKKLELKRVEDGKRLQYVYLLLLQTCDCKYLCIVSLYTCRKKKVVVNSDNQQAFTFGNSLKARKSLDRKPSHHRNSELLAESHAFTSYYEQLHEDDDSLLADTDERLKSFDPEELQKVGVIMLLYIGVCFIHKAANFNNTTIAIYFLTSLAILFVSLVFYGRKSILVPVNEYQFRFCLTIDTLTDTNVFGHIACVVLLLFALSGYIFLYCLLLIEFVNNSVVAKDTVRSMTTPWKQLVIVFILYTLIIFTFGIMSLVRYGGRNSIYMAGETRAPDDDSLVECSSAFSCLGNVFYSGFLNLDISNVLAAPSQTETSWGSRLFFDIPFYILAGCLLIQVVAGIIVDTFADLRQRSEKIERLRKEETFVSGITNDMLDCTNITFDDIQNNCQNMWDYVFYAIYLERKDPALYNGIESYVASCLEKDIIIWFPRKTSADLESLQKLKKTTDGDGDRLEEAELPAVGANAHFDVLSERMKNVEMALAR